MTDHIINHRNCLIAHRDDRSQGISLTGRSLTDRHQLLQIGNLIFFMFFLILPLQYCYCIIAIE